MSEAKRNFLVGFFVLGGLGALAILIVMFGQAPAWLVSGETYPLYIRLPSAAGIKQGTLVTVHGKMVGRVRDTEFVDPDRLSEGVRVIVDIDKDFHLPAGSRAQTSEPGLGQGRPPIEILPGPAAAPMLAAGQELPGRISSAAESLIPPRVLATFESVATQIGDAATALKPVLEDLHGVLQPRTPSEVDVEGGPPGNLASASARLDATLKHFNEVLGDAAVQSNLRATLENLSKASEQSNLVIADLKIALEEARGGVEEYKKLAVKGQDTLVRVDQNVDAVGRAAVGGMEQASWVLTDLGQLTAGLNRGEGTLGRLLKDDRFYEALTLTSQRLAEMLTEFRALAEEWRKGKVRVAL